MRRLRTISPFLTLILTPILASVGEEAQVIRSAKTVLTIYSYGSGQGLRFTPELPERKSRTGALSDVVDSPPLSSHVSAWSQTSSVATHRHMAAPTTSTAPKTAAAISGGTSAESGLTTVAIAPSVVFLEFQPSPDQSVVGYN